MWRRLKDMVLGVFIGGFLVTGIIAAVASDGSGVSEWTRLLPFSQTNLMIMKQARSVIEMYHIDGVKNQGEKKLFFGAMSGMIAAVDDPYTRFVDPEQLGQENLELAGEYAGVGMYIGQREGKILVISPIDDTPAYRAGIKPMDEIIKINDKVVVGMNQDEVVKMLRGPAKTSVTVWMRRSGVNELKSFKLTREIINIRTVRMEMIDKVAYIRLSNFHHKTSGELAKVMAEAGKKKATGIVLDVRDNPGGLLNVAVDVASQFLNGGLVVSMKGRDARFDDALYADTGKATSLPLVVLVNEGSASASEIVAGAVQDSKRGVLVGTKTYGKGSVQSLFNLPDGAGMYVTIARYATPAGRIIDHKGLNPDYKVEGRPMPDRAKDKQLQKALGILKGKSALPKKK